MDDMAKNDEPEQTDDAPAGPEPPRRSKVKSLLTVGLCAALAAGGYVLGGRTATAGEPEQTATATIEGEDGVPVPVEFDEAWCEGVGVEPVLGEVIDLPAMNVNLADNHYLRVAVSLGFEDGAVDSDPERFVAAPAQDIVLSLFSGRTQTELRSPEGRETVKEELTERIVAHYGEDVMAVYLTEFVMQ